MADFPSAAAAGSQRHEKSPMNNGTVAELDVPVTEGEGVKFARLSESNKGRRPSRKVPKLGRENAFYILPDEEAGKDLNGIIQEQKCCEKLEVKEVIPEA
ncbi:hypothetical protein RUND412_009968 [Rhizina undulata]